MARVRTLSAVVAVGLLVTACGGDDGALEAGDGYSVASALAEIPAEVGTDEVYVSSADLEAVCTANSCQRPDGVDDQDAAQEWLSSMTGVNMESDAGVFAPVPSSLNARMGMFGEFHDQLGWSLVDVDSFVAFEVPPEVFTVVSGDVTLSDDLTEMDDGVVTTTDAEDGAVDPNETSPVDDLGRPVRLTEEDNRIALSVTTPPVEAWSDGPEETLADDDDLHDIATTLDDADVVSAVLARSDFTGGANPGDAVLEPFDAVGIGWWVDDEEPTVTVVYQHGSTEDAEANADATASVFDEDAPTMSGEPLKNLFTLEDVTTDDTIVTVTLRFADDAHPENILQMLQNRDILFAHT